MIFLAGVALSFAVHGQAGRDANPREDQNTEGAQREGSAMDPKTKARVRTEGATGGIQGGVKTEEQKKGGASAGGSPGRPERSRSGEGGRMHNETSSDREEGRGARGHPLKTLSPRVVRPLQRGVGRILITQSGGSKACVNYSQ
jgi:hypothetical protein